jgi:beta-mannan synthase
MVEMECQRWASKGINITYQIRENRGGYKAGALKEGLKRSYVKHCEYVVIFDADFSPPPGFLRRAIPFLVGNPELALVQGRWRFGKQIKHRLILMHCRSEFFFTELTNHDQSYVSFFGYNHM